MHAPPITRLFSALFLVPVLLWGGGPRGSRGLTPHLVAAQQGERLDGDPVDAERSDPQDALVRDSDVRDRFYALGLGGAVTVAFDCPLREAPGPELRVFEVTTPGYPVEEAAVYALVEGRAYRLATVRSRPSGPDRVTPSYVDLRDATDGEGNPVRLEQAQTFRIVDVTNPARFRSRPNADGFDLDGVEALQRCAAPAGGDAG